MNEKKRKQCIPVCGYLLWLLLTPGLVACQSMYYGGLPQGDPASGYGITGFVSASPSTAAPGVAVTLVALSSGETIGSVQTDAMGKYTFYPLQPGSYQIKVGSLTLPATVTASHVRLDVDLSAADGKANLLSEDSGPLEPIDLQVTYNNNGSPILTAEGKEYLLCD